MLAQSPLNFNIMYLYNIFECFTTILIANIIYKFNFCIRNLCDRVTSMRVPCNALNQLSNRYVFQLLCLDKEHELQHDVI